MQPTIAAFFQRSEESSKKLKSGSDKVASKGTKKRKVVIVSSDEDEVPASPQVKKARGSKKRADESTTKSPAKGADKPKLNKLKASPQKLLKPVDPSVLFGGETKRIEAKKPPKPKEKALVELEDDDVNQSLMEMDLNESLLGTRHTETSQTTSVSHKTSPKSARPSSATPKPKDEENTTPPSAEKPDQKRGSSAKKTTQRVKKEHQDLESSVLSDEERHERKRAAAMLFQKYKNRPTVLNHGSKEVPKGKPNCLAGLTFFITGVLESLERDEAYDLIKQYGGRTMSTVGKRLNYLIVGEEAGPSKLAHAQELGIKMLSEDDLFDLIRSKSGVKEEETDVSHEGGEETATTSPKVRKVGQSSDEKIRIKKEKSSTPPEKKRKLEEPHPKVKQNPEEQIPMKTEMKSESLDTKSSIAIDNNMVAWVDKYKPTSVKDIIGQQGCTSNVAKLMKWLSKWYTNHDGKKKLQKPNPWAKNDDGSYYKAALLSGPPGIGKTTTATLVCKELGFDAVEFNASDTRNKRLLKEEVSELLSSKSLYGYFHGNRQTVTKKHVLIMDEVDGMAGNEDRGGIQELIGLIKDSSIPIICMCNDRNHQKMRSLVNYCYDLRFNRPQLKQIKACIMSICAKENMKIDSSKIEEIIAATNNDIRQSINHISLLSAGKELNFVSNQKAADKTAEKDLKMGPWEVVRKVFSADEHKSMSFYDKCDLFFHDYSLGPLFVQQNYLQVLPVGPKSDVPRKVALAADALSLGDLVEKRIRADSAWSLLPTQAIFSSVMPGEYMSGHITGQINFPGWLGKNSRANKRSRLAQEIHDHTRSRTSGSRLSIRLDYAPYLLSKIVRPLVERGMDGVEEALDTLKEYRLLREDIESLVELTTWPGKKGLMDAVEGRVKAALTRSYNKEVMAYSYSVTAGVKKKRIGTTDEMEVLEGMEGEGGELLADSDEDRDADNLENDGLIKAKKKGVAPSSSSTSSKSTSAKASTSKKSLTGNGKTKPTASKVKK